MLKILEKNLTVREVRGYWRQFAGLVTGFATKYHFDLFFRTECKIIGLQVIFTVFILLVFGFASLYLFNEIAPSVLELSRQMLEREEYIAFEAAFREQMESMMMNNFVQVSLLVLSAAALFGFIIARITLKPTRDALTSQKQFIGNIAHELRTPLSIIKTNTEVALLDDKLEEKFKKIFESNIEELDRTSEIINNLLTMNALMRPERILFADVDLGKMVSAAVTKLSELAEQKHLEITLRQSEFRLVFGNSTALGQIIINLLKNAILYSYPNGHISISILPNYRGYIELTVEDSGIGIARKDLFHIFEPFYRTNSSRVYRSGGSGLGLTIVSELVKLHHGKISIRSTPKHGTTVVISLPCGKVDGAVSAEETGGRMRGEEIAVDFSH